MRLIPSAPISRRGLLAAAASGLAVPALEGEESPAPLPPSDEAAVNAKHANVLRKYGDGLSERQKVRAREIIVRHQRMLMRVRDFALENSDAPATGLRLVDGLNGHGR
jgi:hypothetical protein